MELPAFPIETDEISVVMVMQVFEAEDGRLVCGIRNLVGKVTAPPKQWLRAVRAEMRKLEGLARDAGCKEMRLRGRDWSRILPDYEPLDGTPNGLRKDL